MDNRNGMRWRIARVSVAVLLGVGGCIDYGLSEQEEEWEEQQEWQLSEFQDCTSVIGDRYWYQEHEFGVVMIYDGCKPIVYNAYMLIEHEFELMNQAWTTASYVTQNGDEITVDAVLYTLGFWYNPVDLEFAVVPFQGNTALGLHEFWIDCLDDDDTRCDIDYFQGMGSQDLE